MLIRTALLCLLLAGHLSSAAFGSPASGEIGLQGDPAQAKERPSHFPPPGYLDLTDEQIAAVEILRDALRDELGPLRADLAADRQELRGLLDEANPDAATVGQLTIDIDRQQAQARDLLQAFEEDFSALLDEVQTIKYESFLELRRWARRDHPRRGGASEEA